MGYSNAQKLGAEFVGSAFLLATIVGSGIMGEQLAEGNQALALLPNSLSTGAILAVIITMLAPISGAHFNPAVTLAFLARKEISAALALRYVIAQFAGAVGGVFAAHLMFELPLIEFSTKARAGTGHFSAEVIATFGLLLTIFATRKAKPDFVPIAVALFITAAYWFTASTSFANPAVTVARSLSDSFSGIRAADAPLFIAAQIIGTLAALPVCNWLLADSCETTEGTLHSPTAD